MQHATFLLKLVSKVAGMQNVIPGALGGEGAFVEVDGRGGEGERPDGFAEGEEGAADVMVSFDAAEGEVGVVAPFFRRPAERFQLLIELIFEGV